ncbi:hypothetical protein N8535_01435 [bacterium]|nr:hypothetical protein [bacterium]
MSWTSNNAQPNKEVVHTHHPLPVYAIMANGLGLGMLFSHALHFASISSGYKLNDRLIRPANVVVAKPASSGDSETEVS